MKKLLMAVSCALLLGGLGVCSASAATFDWSFTGVDTGNGTFTATPTGTSGVYQITGITGTVNSSKFGTATILGVIPPDTFPFGGIPANSNFNYLYYPEVIPADAPAYQTQPSYLDINGVSFFLGNIGNCSLNTPMTGCFNLYYGSDAGVPTAATTGYNLLYPDTGTNDLLSSFSVVEETTPIAGTPEPSSLILLGTGAVGVFGAARRRLTRA